MAQHCNLPQLILTSPVIKTVKL